MGRGVVVGNYAAGLPPGSPASYASPAFEFQASITGTVTEIDVAVSSEIPSSDYRDASLELFSGTGGVVGAEIGGPYGFMAEFGANPFESVFISGGQH